MSPPEMRKPVPGRTGSLEVSSIPALDIHSIVENAVERQVTLLLARFSLSVPTARVVAELAFGRPS